MHSICITLMSTLVITGTIIPSQAADFKNPEPVTILGYDDHIMEPFLSRDDKTLLFNNKNHPPSETDLHWATRITPTKFQYQGKIKGANSGALEGVPSMDENGTLYFVSTRSYFKTHKTIYHAKFHNGRATDVETTLGLSKNKLGELNFDAEISADGSYIIANDGTFSGGPAPKKANLFLAVKKGDRFVRTSPDFMKNINTDNLEYAPALSADGLELFYTKVTGTLFWKKLHIMHATRRTTNSAFSKPKKIQAITGFVEGPTISRDGRSLYYHKRVDGLHRLYRVTR